MSLARLPPCDVELEAIQRDDRSYRITLRLRNPLHAGWPAKLVADPYNYPRMVELSHEVYATLNQFVSETQFAPGQLNDARLKKHLEPLNNLLYGMRFPEVNRSLGEILAEVIVRRKPLLLSVNNEIGMLPWELTSLAPGTPLLGSLLQIYGSLAHKHEAASEELNLDGILEVGAVKGASRAPLTFETGLRIRGAGDHRLAGAAAEEALILNPGGITTGTIAPWVSSKATEPAFFSHFGPAGYEIVHFFNHCRYDANGFMLSVSNKYNLGILDFNSHRAEFPRNAFHFLNVCSGAPSPATRHRSLVEYVVRQHSAGGLIASMIAVRSNAAVEMAREFYARFLPKEHGSSGLPAVEALSGARDALWNNGMAAGYLYRAYGRPDAFLVPIDAQLARGEHEDD